MGQQVLSSQANHEDSRETGTEQCLEPINPASARSDQFAPGKPGCPKSDSGHSQVWLGAILCSFFLHRWSDLRDTTGADAHRAAPAQHRFMHAGSGHGGAPHATSTRRSRHPLEQSNLMGAGAPAVLPGRQPQLTLFWRLPGLLLTFLLLAWLLLL